MTKKNEEYKTDKRGQVHLKDKHGNVYSVLPESVPVWLEDGHTVVDPEKNPADSQPVDLDPNTKK